MILKLRQVGWINSIQNTGHQHCAPEMGGRRPPGRCDNCFDGLAAAWEHGSGQGRLDWMRERLRVSGISWTAWGKPEDVGLNSTSPSNEAFTQVAMTARAWKTYADWQAQPTISIIITFKSDWTATSERLRNDGLPSHLRLGRARGSGQLQA